MQCSSTNLSIPQLRCRVLAPRLHSSFQKPLTDIFQSCHPHQKDQGPLRVHQRLEVDIIFHSFFLMSRDNMEGRSEISVGHRGFPSLVRPPTVRLLKVFPESTLVELPLTNKSMQVNFTRIHSRSSKTSLSLVRPAAISCSYHGYSTCPNLPADSWSPPK